MLTLPAFSRNGAATRTRSIADVKRELLQRVRLPAQRVSLDALFRHEAELAYRQDFLRLAVEPGGASLKARAKSAIKRLLRNALRWVLMRQVEFNAVLLEHSRESSQALTCLDRNDHELYAAWTALDQEAASLAARQEQMDQELAALRSELIACRVRLRRASAAIPAHVDSMSSAATEPAATGIDYFLFFNRFRGSREEVLAQQAVYVDYFHDQGEILDIGCGRGEFVELLLREQVPVHGIDANQDMADFCQELGLPVSCEEAAHYLSRREEGSLGGVFLGRFAEQLSTDSLAGLLGQCWAKLRKGGVLVIEAVNPVCPAALADFHADPARLRPVHPAWLEFLLESERFRRQEYVYTCPTEPAALPLLKQAVHSFAEAARYKNYALVGYK